METIKIFRIEEVGNATEHLVLGNTAEQVQRYIKEREYGDENMPAGFFHTTVLRDMGMYKETQPRLLATILTDDDILYVGGEEIRL